MMLMNGAGREQGMYRNMARFQVAVTQHQQKLAVVNGLFCFVA